MVTTADVDVAAAAPAAVVPEIFPLAAVAGDEDPGTRARRAHYPGGGSVERPTLTYKMNKVKVIVLICEIRFTSMPIEMLR